MNIERKLSEMGLNIPDKTGKEKKGNGITIVDRSVYISSQLPLKNCEIKYKGKVGEETSLNEAKEAFKLCALNSLALIKDEGVMDNIILTFLHGFILSNEDFQRHEEVFKPCSNFFQKIFGKRGKHVKTIIGTSSLPGNSSVALEVQGRI